MPRPKKSSPKQAIEPPQEASLLGLPAELRNRIYHLVADDIEEANIIGRKIGCDFRNAQSIFWQAIAKHPLKQTCRQLRQEFDPIHRCRVMTTGVPYYYLLVENYDLDGLGYFGGLLKQVPSMRRHLSKSAYSFEVIFCLNQKVEACVMQLSEHAEQWDRISSSVRKLSAALAGGNEYFFDPNFVARVELNIRNDAMAAAEKKAAISQRQNNNAKRVLKEICDFFKAPSHFSRIGDTDEDIARWLFNIHKKANKDEQRYKKAVREERATARLENWLRTEIETELKAKLREEIEAELKPKLRAEIEDELREQLRQESSGDGHKN